MSAGNDFGSFCANENIVIEVNQPLHLIGEGKYFLALSLPVGARA